MEYIYYIIKLFNSTYNYKKTTKNSTKVIKYVILTQKLIFYRRDILKNEKIFELLSAVILSMALIVGCGSSKSDDELVVYFVPSRDSKEIQSATQPLADMLKEELAKE